MKQMLHRVLLPLLCLILLVGSFPTALADTQDPEGAREALLQAYEDLASVEGTSHTIDFKDYGLTTTEVDELIVSTGLHQEGLQPWYLETYSYRYNADTDIVQSLTLNRKDPAIYDYDLYEQRMAEILAATVFEGMSQWQTALSIHDYLVTHIRYDETLTHRDAYAALTLGTTVCSGYAELYMYLLHRVGINSRYVSSEAMNHGWNVVQIDGVWYHVDATWDDPTADTFGRCRHHYFLLSDSALADENHNHHSWSTDIVCSDTTMDTNRFWQEIDSPICYESAEICYFRQKTGKTSYTIYRRDREGNQTVVTTTDAGHIDIGGEEGYRYFYENYGLDLVGDRLYYADMTAIYSIKTDGTDKKTLYTHNTDANKTCIQGTFVEGNTLHVALRDHEGNRSTMTLDLGGENHVHSYTAQVVQATCTQPGHTRYSCACGVSYQADLTPKQDHTYDGGTVIKAATLSEPGIKRCVCTVCGESKDIEIPILTGDGNNPLTDEDGVDEEEYTIRRIIVGVVAVFLVSRLFKKKR